MTKRIGYTEIIAPTPAQIADLERRLQSGELLRLVFENDGVGNVTGAHFRRNHHYQPKVDINTGIPEPTPKFCNQSDVKDTPIMGFRPGATSPEDRLVPRRVIDRVPPAPTRDSGGKSDDPSGREYFLVLLAGALIGAFIAILTK